MSIINLALLASSASVTPIDYQEMAKGMVLGAYDYTAAELEGNI